MWDLVINQHLASSFVLPDLIVKVLKWINHKTIPLIVSCFVYHWIWFKCECITTDRLQNNTVESALRVLRCIDFEMIPLNLCWRYDIGSIPKQYHPNMCFSSMTCAYKWMIYEVPYQIDSVLILRISFIYNFLWITHRSFELLTDHLPCYSHNYIGNTQRRNKYND